MSKKIATTLPTKAGIYHGIPNEVYHHNVKAINKSILDAIAKTPKHAYDYLHRERQEPTDALIIGGAVDSLVFEPDQFDAQYYVGLPHGKMKKDDKAAWADHDKANKGKRCLTQHTQAEVWQNAQKMANAIKANGKFQELTKTGTGQAVALAHDPNTKMLCKAKADWYCPERRLIVDLKTAEHADADSFARSIANYRYHVQDAFYRMVFSVASGVPVERFIFAVMEKPEKGIDPHPDRMAFYELTYEEVVAASNTFSSDLEALQYCMDNDTWAGYPQEPLPIMRPHWAMKNDI